MPGGRRGSQDGGLATPAAGWGDPADVVLDSVGGDIVQRGVDALTPFGRLVAFSAGGGTVDTGSLLGGLKSVVGFSIGLVDRTRPDLVAQRRGNIASHRQLSDGLRGTDSRSEKKYLIRFRRRMRR